MARHLRAALILAAIVAAATCGLAAPVARFSDAITEDTFVVITYSSGSIAVALFASMLFDPAIHHAVKAMNREMNKSRSISLFDEEWGLFGAKAGSKLLLALRCILFVEFLLALVTTRKSEWLYGAAPLALAALGFALSMLLFFEQLKNHYPRPKSP